MSQNNNKKNQNKQNTGKKITLLIAAVLLIGITASLYIVKQVQTSKDSTQANGSTAVTSGADLVIPISEVTDTVKFYPTEIDGVKMEVMAVKATDGTIRTAFNTCQVCYASGRGYYKQEGDVLVCQNCGNQFGVDDVEVTRGGCNPVPILSEDKTVGSDSITISKEYLAEAKEIFANWKSEF